MLMLLTKLGFLLKKLNNFKFGQQLRTSNLFWFHIFVVG